MRRMTVTGVVFAAMTMLPLFGAVSAAERSIGAPVETQGMRIGAVYLQGVVMAPEDDICGPKSADIHLEADIHAVAGNPSGLGKGEWVPYLTVTYVLSKPGGDFSSSGPLVPMVANDGPHYGRNIVMDGPGKYHLTVIIQPPMVGFYRHTDKETGVAAWWAPFSRDWDFTYIGSTGKKGGY